MLVAPASANTMAKMAYGICDNLLLTTYLSVRCPVMLAPAMDFDMFAHPATQDNIRILSSRGNIIVEPASGELASGLSGKGRMEEPERILEEVISFFQQKKKLKGNKFLVTAGPTLEPIDPVRFIGNHSSGKMGFAVAESLSKHGAEVILVSGPVSLPDPGGNVKTIRVNTASEMFAVCKKHFPSCRGAVMTAAVADYAPEKSSSSKIKRSETSMTLKLVANPDIAASLGKLKKKNQVLIGFALETDNPVENARKKLKKKNLDFIVLNSLDVKGAGFGTDTNQVTIIDKNNKVTKFELKPKSQVADDIVEAISQMLKK
jgi:phosphopantothenoylcysteine decarboxylase/phosphopantothenate--cysteine ligase